MASITINWTAAPGTISGYNVRRGIGLGNELPTPLNGSILIPSGTLTFTDTTAVAGQTYSYSVTSVRNGVDSAPSQVLKTAPFPASPSPLNFGTASSFGVLATTAITNTGATTVTGDIGVSPSGAITLGGLTFTGVSHTNDSVSLSAQADASTAFTNGNLLTPTGALAGAIGGTTITTGVYNQASSVGITGILTLDAQGDPNAVFVFQIGTTLTTATSASVSLINGAQAANVFWLVGSSATLGTSTVFAGNIIANTSITVNGGAGAVVNGKLIALGAAVTFSAITAVNTSVFGFATSGRFRYYDFGTPYAVGEFLFQDNTGHLQECIVAGTSSGSVLPPFSGVPGSTTVDGTVTWLTVDPLSVAILAPTVVGAPPGTPGPVS